jgi:TolB protein
MGILTRRRRAGVVIAAIASLAWLGVASSPPQAAAHPNSRFDGQLAVVAVAALAQTSPAHAIPTATSREKGQFPGLNGRIAVVVDRGSAGVIESVNPDGSDLQLLVGNSNGPLSTPDWSPEGRHLVFSTETASGCSVDMANAHGGDITDLSEARPGCEYEPTFTPDGRRIVFAVQRCESCQQWMESMNLNGRDRRKIVMAPAGVEFSDINVAPDGSRIAFVGQRATYRRGLYTVGMNGSHLKEILPLSLDVGARFDWAPDGRRIVFTRYSESPPGHQPNVATVRPDGTHQIVLTYVSQPGVGDGGATYSPDGRWIVYRYENDNNNHIWLTKMHPNGRDKTRIRRFPAIQGSAWAPRPTR